MSQVHDGFATIRKRGPKLRPRTSPLPVTPPELEEDKLPTLLILRKPISQQKYTHENNNTHAYDRHLLRSQSCDDQNFPENQPTRNGSVSSRLKYRNSFTFANRTIYEEGSNGANFEESSGNNQTFVDDTVTLRNRAGRYATLGASEKRNQNVLEHMSNGSFSWDKSESENQNDFEPQFRNGGGRFATLGGGERRRKKENFEANNGLGSFGNEVTRRYTVCQTDASSLGVLNERSDMDYKIGCQTVVRSKPIVPWYELALKNRRSRFYGSCPVIPEAHVVSAFEQSLQNMTQRLQQLTVTAERKDSEVLEMRQTIELLRKQSVQAGLTSAHMISMGVPQNGVVPPSPNNTATSNQGNATCSSRPNMTRHLSTDSMSSLNSLSSSCSAQDKKKKKGWLRSSFTKAFSRNAKISKTSRHPSSENATDGPGELGGINLPDSPRSPSRSPAKTNIPQASSTPNNGQINGNGTNNQLTHQQVQTTPDRESRSEDQQVEELRKQLREKDLVLTDIRLEALTSAHQLESLKDTVIKMRTEMMNLKQNNERLQRLVTSRSLAGSEVSLGGSVASSSDPRRCSATDSMALRPSMELPHYLSETDEDAVNLMPCDPPEPAESPPMNGSAGSVMADPDRDHSDQSSGTSPDQSSGTSPDREHSTRSATTDAGGELEGKRIAICVYLGQPDSFLRYLDEIGALNHGGHEQHYITTENNHESEFYKHQQSYHQQPSANEEFTIAYTRISGKTSWQNLDDVVRKTFRDYLSRVDPGSNLGLNTDSITSYHLGEAKRGPDTGLPELLPCGYIVGRVRALYICLQGVGGLAFDSLIPRSIVNRYVSLLSEHHRLILCGPRGTGKSYLARRLAEFLVARSGHANPNEAIATFHVDHKNGSAGELRQYLSHVAEIAASSLTLDGTAAGSLPEVIILDDLHNAGAGALADAFGGLLAVSGGNANGENGRGALPRIIGTMSQATCNTTNLQLHHNFRWVLTANHMEPVKGFLARYLRRHVFSIELRTGVAQSELSRVLQWLPAVWSHVNRFLEAHSSSDVTLGPGLFLQCPLDVKRSQVWFTNIWNYKLAPFIVEAVREGVALYGRRGGAWQDPSIFLRETYPWTTSLPGTGAGNTCGVSPQSLRRVTAEDVGLADGDTVEHDLVDGENGVHTNGETQDPLSNMLMRLQEAANYSGNQSNDSDSASVDSNMTHDSSAGID